MNYSHSLPNYICAQVTRRFYDPAGNEEWHLADIILARLTYFEQKEDYKLITVNNNVVTDKAYTSVRGAISEGEFGSTMREIFDPKSNTEFSWQRWATLRGHDMYIFAYRVPLASSQYTIHYQGKSFRQGPDSLGGISWFRFH